MSDTNSNLQTASNDIHNITKTIINLQSLYEIIYYVNIIFCIIVIIIIVIISIIAIWNYINFQYHSISKAVKESDPFNAQQIRLCDTFDYQFLKYIFCNAEETDANKKAGFGNIIFTPCKEPFLFNIYGIKYLYNIIFNYIINFLLIIGFASLFIYLAIYIFSRGINYIELQGNSSAMSFIFTHDEGKKRWIFYIIAYSLLCYFTYDILYKLYFEDIVVKALFENFNLLKTLDYELHFAICSEFNPETSTEKNILNYGGSKCLISDSFQSFISTLINTTQDAIDVNTDSAASTKILSDINTSFSDIEMTVKKIFIYTIYIFILRNKKESDDKEEDIITKINEILAQKPENIDSLRGFLPVNLPQKIVLQQLNDIVSEIGVKLAGLKQASTSTSTSTSTGTCSTSSSNPLEFFDFKTMSELTTSTLESKLAKKIKKFYDIMISLEDKLVFKSVVIKQSNLFLAVFMVISLILMLILFIIIKFTAVNDPYVKKIIDYIIEAVKVAIDEIYWGIVF
jgi:hypothetical protein